MADLYPLARPFLRRLSPETAHRLTIHLLSAGLGPAQREPDPPILQTDFLGLRLPNPIGIAAGFDKNAEAPDALLRMGFGFVEVGTITPRPQPGNPKPRIFRLEEDEAVINRLGFNSEGASESRRRLAKRRARGRPGVIAINIGPNKDSDDRIDDYVWLMQRFAGLGDYFVINVSSPNTPGLRDLQSGSALDELLSAVVETREMMRSAKFMPVLVKVAPDLDPAQREAMAAAVLQHQIDGMVVGNTTLSRPDSLQSGRKSEEGGLSGQPLKPIASAVLRDFYRLTDGRVPLVGVGGIASGRDAYERIRAGASVVQLYSALTYHGPALVQRIKQDLAGLLSKDGFSSVEEAVGTG